MECGFRTGNRMLYLDTVETLVVSSGFQVIHKEVRGELCVEPTEKLRLFLPPQSRAGSLAPCKEGWHYATLWGFFLCVNKFVRHFRKEERWDREGRAIRFLIRGSEKEVWKDRVDQLLLYVMPTNNRPSLVRFKPHFANKLNLLDSNKMRGTRGKIMFQGEKKPIIYLLLNLIFTFFEVLWWIWNLNWILNSSLHTYKAALISFSSL